MQSAVRAAHGDTREHRGCRQQSAASFFSGKINDLYVKITFASDVAREEGMKRMSYWVSAQHPVYAGENICI